MSRKVAPAEAVKVKGASAGRKNSVSIVVETPGGNRRAGVGATVQLTKHAHKKTNSVDSKTSSQLGTRETRRKPSHMPSTAETKAAPNVLLSFNPERLACKPPKTMKRKKGEKPSADLVGLSRFDIATLWQYYDRNQNGLLDPDEVDQLADDFLAAFPSVYKALIRRERPTLHDRSIEEMVRSDLPHVLPGNKAYVVHFLSKELTFNYPANRKIREHEFTVRWNHAAQVLFAGIQGNRDGELGCAIL